MKSQGAGLWAGRAGLDMYRVVQHLVREPCKSQGIGVVADADLDMYRVVQHLMREYKA